MISLPDERQASSQKKLEIIGLDKEAFEELVNPEDTGGKIVTLLKKLGG